MSVKNQKKKLRSYPCVKKTITKSKRTPLKKKNVFVKKNKKMINVNKNTHHLFKTNGKVYGKSYSRH